MVTTPKPPEPPDPQKTAAAQTGTNVATAQANAAMNNINQITPYGNLTYSQTGTQHINDPNGPAGGYNVPTYTATQTLSPTQQATLDQTQQANLHLGTLANQQAAKMQSYLNTPLDLSAANIDTYSNKHWMPQFNNTWDRNLVSERQYLADMGASVGSEAYSNAMRDYTNNRQSAQDQYLGDMFDRSVNSILTQRNQPINEIGALLSGSQVHQPTYAGMSGTSAIPTTDYAGLVNQNYNQKLGIYNQQLQSSQAGMGGLFGLGSALLGGWAMSDRRLKRDIELIGTLPNGIPWYEFSYIWGSERLTGVMADEVEPIMPEAVKDGPGGFKMVNYDLVWGA